MTTNTEPRKADFFAYETCPACQRKLKDHSFEQYNRCHDRFMGLGDEVE